MAFVVLMWVSVLTVIVGANLPGLGMAAAVGLGWLLSRYLPGLGDTSEAVSDASDEGDDRDRPRVEVALRHRSNRRGRPHIGGIR